MCLSSGKKLEKKNIVNHRICWIKVEYAELYIYMQDFNFNLFDTYSKTELFISLPASFYCSH